MKRILALPLLFLLSSCASAPEPNQAIEVSLNEAMTACYTAEGDIEVARLAKITDPKDILLDRAIKGLSEAAGKHVDRCAKVTNNDLQKVAMEENTKQIAHASDFGKSAAGNIIVGLGVWKGLDVLPELFANAGTSIAVSNTGAGALTLTDSVKTSTMGKISGTNQIGGILNPSTAEPFVVDPLVIQ